MIDRQRGSCDTTIGMLHISDDQIVVLATRIDCCWQLATKEFSDALLFRVKRSECTHFKCHNSVQVKLVIDLECFL